MLYTCKGAADPSVWGASTSLMYVGDEHLDMLLLENPVRQRLKVLSSLFNISFDLLGCHLNLCCCAAVLADAQGFHGR